MMKLSNFALAMTVALARAGISHGELCVKDLVGADIVLLFDESGSMSAEQAAAANNAGLLFNAFKQKTGDNPRFAVGGFGRSASSQNLREVTNLFVDTQTELTSALNSLVTNGGWEPGFTALIDTFDGSAGKLDWDFTPGGRSCVILFTDEDSDGPYTPADVINARGSNSIIPVIKDGGITGTSNYPYPPVSSMPNNGYIDLDVFTSTPGQAIADIVDACVDTLYESCIENRNGGAMGDPHFKTWSGDWYDFHGICDLVLLDAPDFNNGMGLTIHVRTKPRYEYSFIESATLKIGDDVLEVGAWGNYILNGVSRPDLPETMSSAGFQITYKEKKEMFHAFNVVLSSTESIELSSFKDMVNVKINNASRANFGSSTGMMGSFADGRLMARDGVTVINDHNKFGQEWQVLESEPNLFMTPSPHLGAECAPPALTNKDRRRLGEATVKKVAAEQACAHHKNADMFDMCVFDVMAMDDLEVANAHGAF